jgi:hypothetical protein
VLGRGVGRAVGFRVGCGVGCDVGSKTLAAPSYIPAGQNDLQLNAEDAPNVPEYIPSPQGTQTALFDAAEVVPQVPAAQLVQLAMPACAPKVPAAQPTQLLIGPCNDQNHFDRSVDPVLSSTPPEGCATTVAINPAPLATLYALN